MYQTIKPSVPWKSKSSFENKPPQLAAKSFNVFDYSLSGSKLATAL
jgi:hypothetical protein